MPAETVSVGVGEPQLAVTVGRAEGVPGERNQQERSLVEAHQHQPLSPVDGRKFRGMVGPCLAHVVGEAHGHAQAAFLVLDVVVASQCHEASVIQLDHSGVDAGDGTSRRPFGKGRQGLSIPRVGPGLSLVLADVDGCSVAAARAGVTGLHEPAFAGHHRAGNDLVAQRVFGSDDARTCPGGTVVRAGAQGHGEVLPSAQRLHAVDVVEGAVPVMEQGGAGHVAVGHLEKQAGRFPLRAAAAQAGGEDCQLPSLLIIGGEPDGEQVAVRTPGDGRLVVVAVERGARTGCRLFHVDDVGVEHRGVHPLGFPVARFVAHGVGIRVRDDGQRFRRRIVSLHHAEAHVHELVLRYHGRAVARTQVLGRCVVTAAPRHPVETVGIAHGVSLGRRHVGTVPVGAPLLDVAAHVIQSPGVGRCLTHLQ